VCTRQCSNNDEVIITQLAELLGANGLNAATNPVAYYSPTDLFRDHHPYTRTQKVGARQPVDDGVAGDSASASSHRTAKVFAPDHPVCSREHWGA